MLPKLYQLATQNDLMVKSNVMLALTFVADCGHTYVNIMMVFCATVFPSLTIFSQHLQAASMRSLGYVSFGGNKEADAILNGGVGRNMRFVLMHPNIQVRRVAL
jgi:hypothetical protein